MIAASSGGTTDIVAMEFIPLQGMIDNDSNEIYSVVKEASDIVNYCRVGKKKSSA